MIRKGVCRGNLAGFFCYKPQNVEKLLTAHTRYDIFKLQQRIIFILGGKMKYQVGNIVALKDGSTVYIFDVDEKAKKYQVVDTEDGNKMRRISESAVFMFLT